MNFAHMTLATTGVLDTVLGIAVAIIALLFMVVIHEFGHFIVGRLFGFKINEFAIGFGPSIFKKNMKSGTVFSLRPIPLGGFCAFEGEDDDSANPDAFNNKKPWQRLLVLFAGAFFNFMSAILIISLTFTFYGDRMLVVTEQSMEQGAGEVGFELGDVIYAVDGVQLSFVQPAPAVRQGQEERTYSVLRDGERFDIVRTLPSQDNSTGESSGFYLYYEPVRLSFFESFGRGFGTCFRLVGLILESVGGLFTKDTSIEDMGGPVTVITMMGESLSSGIGTFMYIVCLISANLAVMNLLPLPALDGSRMVFVTIEWLRGKPVNRKVEGIIHFAGLVLLFAFAILVDLIKVI
ncbi:MAG: site-2 protease family protein [Clostridia bacterium]|nr:site-2 protease family protein [Clostridia bacterium]